MIEAPAIRTQSLPAELPDLAGYDLLVVSSPNGVHELFARLRGTRARWPACGWPRWGPAPRGR